MKAYILYSLFWILFLPISYAQESLLPSPSQQPVWTYINTPWEVPPQQYRVQFRYADDLLEFGSNSYLVIEMMRLNANGDTLVQEQAYLREEGDVLWGLQNMETVGYQEVKLMDISVEAGDTVRLHSMYYGGESDTGHVVTLTSVNMVEGEDGVLREKYTFEAAGAEPGSITFVKGLGFINRPFGAISATIDDLYDLQCLHFGADELIFFDPDPGLLGSTSQEGPEICNSLGAVLNLKENSGALSNEMQAFPNPVSDVLNIVRSNARVNELYIVHDISGRVIIQGILTRTSQDVLVGHLSKGIYLLHVDGHDNPSTLKFFKK